MAQFKTGTVTVTNGSDAVTGVGMLWLANISVGDWFIRKGDDVSYQVKAVLTDISLTLATNYAGVTASGVTYSVTTDFTANFNIPLLARGDIDTATVFARAMAEIDKLFGQNTGEWIDFNQTPTFVDADTFTFVGDQTDEHHVDRRIRIQDSVELYGTITSSVFTTLTTIDVRLDTGSITSAISAVAVGAASADGRQSISGSGIKSGAPEVDTIAEDTAGAGVTIDGALLKDGNVDGRDLAVDGTKLDGIETAATADQTGAEIASALSGEAVTGLTDLESAVIQLKGQKLQAFELRLVNTAGTLQHQIGRVGNAGASTNHADKIVGASTTLTNTPTGADASTAFATGAKIGSADTNTIWLDTAAQVPGDEVITAVIGRNQSGTDLTMRGGGSFAAIDINGATVNRPRFQIFDTASGAAFALNTTNIASGKSISILFFGYLT